jgi:polyhydroxyalkanoate synthase
MPRIELPTPRGLTARAQRELTRGVGRSRNAVRMLTGTDVPAPGPTPKDVVWNRGKTELWRYRSTHRTQDRPILIVHSLVTRSFAFDLAEGNSCVQFLLDRGHDVYLVNWGEPDELDAGNDLSTYCDELLPELVAETVATSGADKVVLLGYCLGGLLTLLYAAGHSEDPVAAVALLATPIDLTGMGPVGTLLKAGRLDLRALLDYTGNAPASVPRNLFRLLQPGVELTGHVNLLQYLWDDTFVRHYRIMTQWANDHVPFPGACFVELGELARRGEPASGHARIGTRRVELDKITVPFLSVVGTRDHLVPPAASGTPCELVGSADAEHVELESGHVGLILGRGAHRTTLPALATWFERHTSITTAEVAL